VKLIHEMASHATRPIPIESWSVQKVVVWAAECPLSDDNRPSIVAFLRGGITGRNLLALNIAELVKLKLLTYGAASELMRAIAELKAEMGTLRA